MRDDPSGADLIEAARKALTDEILPSLTGRPRYVALMVANALGIAAREIGDAHALAAAAPISWAAMTRPGSSRRSGRDGATPLPAFMQPSPFTPMSPRAFGKHKELERLACAVSVEL